MEKAIDGIGISEKPRCSAKTKVGGPCKNYAQETSVFCSSHRHLDKQVVVYREKKAIVEEVVVDEERLARLNEAARLILDHLTPEVRREFEIAAKEWDIQDISIYILGLLNRLYKTVDYYNPDIEPEWQKRVVGYDDKLLCQNCNELIINPVHLKQKFCCNLCAKEYANASKNTGIVYPSTADLGTEEEQDAAAYEKEQTRIYGA